MEESKDALFLSDERRRGGEGGDPDPLSYVIPSRQALRARTDRRRFF
jgi:hypothetical protein